MSYKTVLILHRKSANEPAVMEAVKTVKKEGFDLRVLVPFNKAEKPRVAAIRNEAKKLGCRTELGNQTQWRAFQASLPAPTTKQD